MSTIRSPASPFAVPRACLQTGLYAAERGCYRNGIPLPGDSHTLAHYFKEADYDTAYIGKWHLADSGHGPVPPEQRGGYDYWLASNLLEYTSDAYDLVMYDNDGLPVKLPGYRVDGQTDAASDHYVEAELYDLLADPEELHNRAGLETHRDVSDVLRSRLIRRMIEANEDEPIIEPAPMLPGSGQLRVDIEDGWL